ncbi:capsular biosynthesis protein [Sphingomonas baiyangensis]|uniref:Capsular biosynthesis protein n=1 Tax=Sphingomonas baiyangensis TaxID=2572576 RepID=A0A4U1L0Q2_9SPHN|nr:capsular biosynthesis protein [Sphingomonas baiyangensis]TKD50319.1 capsular biosynthesis protein [Sphingomonas baiyangensis]
MTTRIITSGAYVGGELEAEFGRIPPAFLPVGGSLLLYRQIERLAAPGVDLILSLPDDFELTSIELERIAAARVRIVRLDPRLSLGRSIACVLAAIEKTGPVEIVHGDTLIAPPEPDAADAMTVGEVSDGYHWAVVRVEDDRITEVKQGALDREPACAPAILTGFFRFSSPQALLRALIQSGDDFARALDLYASRHPVAAIPNGSWLDFGHLQTYFRSRHHLAAARHFNALRIEAGVVHKSSDNAFKIDAEAAWLRSVPPAIQLHCARLIEPRDRIPDGSYSTEYSYLPTVAELYLSRLGIPGWNRILDAIGDYLTQATRSTGAPGNALAALAVEKTRQRIAAAPHAYPWLDRALRVNGRDCPTGHAVLDRCFAIIEGAPPRASTVMHGDLCFSNILYNSRNQRILLIDPRGYVHDGVASIEGDLRYDVAKLAHSVIGRYDQIIAGEYSLREDGEALELAFPEDATKRWLETAFAARSIDGLAFADPVVLATMVTLFVSMIPLHSDDPVRQKALYVNAMRLFSEHVE